MNWFLRLFRDYVDLESLKISQAEAVETLSARCDQMRESLAAFQSENSSLRIDLESIRAEHDSMISEKRILEDRLDSAAEERERIWTLFQESLRSERSSLKMQVNHAVQKQGGGIPYPDEHSLPPTAVHQPSKPGPVGRAGRILSSQAIHMHNARFIQELSPDQPQPEA